LFLRNGTAAAMSHGYEKIHSDLKGVFGFHLYRASLSHWLAVGRELVSV
jgi:hypothetical protein